MTTKLKPKEELFCTYFAKLQNCKEAAIKAGYASFGAENTGESLLQKACILKKIESIEKKQEFDALELAIIAGLKRLAFDSINDAVKLITLDKDSLCSNVDALDLYHVSEIKVPKEGCLEIKFFDRFKAFEKLLDIIGKKTNKQGASSFFEALERNSQQLCDDDLTGDCDGI